jgi:hypothetical protein
MCQSGLPDIASRSLNDGAKSGSPPVGLVHAHSPIRRFASSPDRRLDQHDEIDRLRKRERP